MKYIDSEKSLIPAFNPSLWLALEWPPEFWMKILDRLYYPVLVFEPQGRLILANAEGIRILGLSGQEGHNLPSYLQPLVNASPNGEFPSAGHKITVNTVDGAFIFTLRTLPTANRGNLVVAAGEKTPIETSHSQASKNAVDESTAMAGKVSQKVKGPLAGIELYASILDEELADSGDCALKSLIEQIRDSLSEVNQYLTSFESMTRDLSLEFKSLNLADIIDNALETMGEIFKVNSIGVLVDQKSIIIEADQTLLTQLFMNLFMNAVEAMPNGGRLSVDIGVNKEGQAEVSITDTGPGIDIYKAKEIFNPFYTTKDQPLGLGLAVSQRIVEAHQGNLTAGSDLNVGARVTVTLPCFPEIPTVPNEASLN
jgi:signal transduction histidine kinase